MKRFVFTCGDINGIGPEIVIKTINKILTNDNKLIAVFPSNIFYGIIKTITPNFKFQIYKSISEIDFNSQEISILDIGEAEQNFGEPTEISGRISFEAIKKSWELISGNMVDAVITAPISKYALSLARINYPGHTEMFAEWSAAKKFNMVFLSDSSDTLLKAGKIRCALVTIHEPISKVSELITYERIIDSIEICAECLINDFSIPEPKIAILGLNPHAGENGLLGDEEEKIIKPAIKNSRYKKFVAGPFVPDAFFANKLYTKFDLVIGMYHDQVLIPFKLLNFSSGVNYTAGLNFVRTSPDHGTAFDIAGKNIADEGSMTEAFIVAEKILSNRQKANAR